MSNRTESRCCRSIVALSCVTLVLLAVCPDADAANTPSTRRLPSIAHPLSADTAFRPSGPFADGFLAADASTWSSQKVVVDNGAQGDFFGWSVAIDGQTALVGAYGVTVDGQEQQGAVYAFTETNGIWTQTATLIADDGRAFDIFGSEVAISGSVAAIGAYQVDRSMGAVYVFTGSGGQWTQKAKLMADDGAASDCLGWSVAVSGTTVLAGAPFAVVDGIQRGAVYAFAPTAGRWGQVQKVIASDGALGDFFGDAVAIDGSIAAIGADSATVGGNLVQGAAYVFDESAGDWAQKTKVTADDGAAFDNFGRSVAISGSTVFVGAPYAVIDGNAYEGAVYVFDGSGNWQQSQKLTASDGTTDGYFGWSVAVSGANAVVGASSYNDNDQGQAYLFGQSNGGWAQTQEVLSGDGTGVDFFGWSVAVSGSSAVIGEPFAQVAGNDAQGAAYFYAPAADAIFADGFD